MEGRIQTPSSQVIPQGKRLALSPWGNGEDSLGQECVVNGEVPGEGASDSVTSRDFFFYRSEWNYHRYREGLRAGQPCSDKYLSGWTLPTSPSLVPCLSFREGVIQGRGQDELSWY